MWKTFQHDDKLYMIKVIQDENLNIYLTDLQNIWMQIVPRDEVLQRFQENNPLYDIKVEDAVTEVIKLINEISESEELVLFESNNELQLTLKSTKSEFQIQFQFNFNKGSSDMFLKEVTVPLIQTVKHLEVCQNVLSNIVQKKDRELEEYKLEKGVISRDDLITEKFNETMLETIDDRSMLNVFGQSETFWDTFTKKYGKIDVKIEDEIEWTPSELRESAQKLTLNLLPEKSKIRYEKTYRDFRDWCSKRGATKYTSESVLLAYFGDVAKTKKPSSMWSNYSMLKSTINCKDNVDISSYAKLVAYIKRQNVGYQPQKSSTFTKENIDNFLKNAPFEFLPHKAAMVIGISGACRSDELFKLKTSDVNLQEHRAIIVLPNSKTYQPRSFVVSDFHWVEILKCYVNLRKKVEGDRFFMQLRHGKLTRQPYGHNSISQFPKKIASYLRLSNESTFTGHCFRRTARTLIVNSGGDPLC